MNNSTIKKFMPIPAFESEAQERAFWESHDSTDYVDWSKAGRVRFPNLKPSSKAISLRVPLDLLERIKIEANRRDVPYQSIKIWLARWIQLSPELPLVAHPHLAYKFVRQQPTGFGTPGVRTPKAVANY